MLIYFIVFILKLPSTSLSPMVQVKVGIGFPPSALHSMVVSEPSTKLFSGDPLCNSLAFWSNIFNDLGFTVMEEHLFN